MVLKSYAKLNLYLEVLRRRPDGYHDLKTLFERIDLADTISLKSRQDGLIKIFSRCRQIPLDERNLAYRAAALLKEDCAVDKGVEIKITKKIPVGSGMGGGSSNAATVLLGLNKLWNLGLSRRKIAALAGKIGSDVPFFLYDWPFAMGRMRGDKVTVLKSLKKVRIWHVLAVPKIFVSTPLIYRKWDQAIGLNSGKKIPKNNQKARLTRPKYDVKILISGLRKNNLTKAGEALFNSLETVTTRLYPELVALKKKLDSLSARAVLMSGSGPTIFAICSSKKEAVRVFRQLSERKASWRLFIARTH